MYRGKRAPCRDKLNSTKQQSTSRQWWSRWETGTNGSMRGAHCCTVELQAVQIYFPVAGALQVCVHEISRVVHAVGTSLVNTPRLNCKGKRLIRAPRQRPHQTSGPSSRKSSLSDFTWDNELHPGSWRSSCWTTKRTLMHEDFTPIDTKTTLQNDSNVRNTRNRRRVFQ